MKGLKKLLTGVLAATLIMSASITAFATDGSESGAIQAQTGTNTITVSKAVENETYNIYRLLDLQVSENALATKNSTSGYSYTINSDWAAFWAGEGAAYIDTKTIGGTTYVTWKATKSSAADMEEFGKKAAAYAKGKGIEVAGAIKVGSDKKAEFEHLVDGYYMVTSTLGSAVSIASTPSNPKQEIEEKNEGTTTEKEVLEKETGKYGKENDAQIGDTVTFVSTVDIAKNQVNVKYLDKMTEGLTYQNDAKVYSDKECTTEVAAANNYAERHENVTYDNENYTFEVAFTDAYVATFTAAKTKLYIKYTAKLNDKAIINHPETNTPEVRYGNGGKHTGEPTKTTTYQFSILKYDGVKFNENDEKIDALAGAKFQLIDKTVANNRITVKLAVSSDGLTYRVVNKDDEIPSGFSLVGDKNEIVTVAKKEITVIGVDDRQYCLVETEAPIGFNKIEGDIDLVIGKQNALLKKVPNLSGALLPSTGGIGTTIFYILGGILIVAGVAYFIVRRKASAE